MKTEKMLNQIGLNIRYPSDEEVDYTDTYLQDNCNSKMNKWFDKFNEYVLT